MLRSFRVRKSNPASKSTSEVEFATGIAPRRRITRGQCEPGSVGIWPNCVGGCSARSVPSQKYGASCACGVGTMR